MSKKRMGTIDGETSAATIDFMKRQNAAGKPFFVRGGNRGGDRRSRQKAR
jgi:hypothetical protein